MHRRGVVGGQGVVPGLPGSVIVDSVPLGHCDEEIGVVDGADEFAGDETGVRGGPFEELAGAVGALEGLGFTGADPEVGDGSNGHLLIVASTLATVDDALRSRLADLCGAEVRMATRVGGGDFATAYRVEFDGDRVVFAKTHRDPPPGFFSTEAAGLRWLGEPGVLPIPVVLGVADDPPACLVMDWVEEGSRAGGDEVGFGRALAALHGAGAGAFGREDRRTTGSLALPNEPLDSWAEFYADRRLRPLAEIAADRSSLPTSTIDRILRVATDPTRWGAADEPPARLHGDLWAGNRVVDAAGRSWLIDPAAHGGHREFDLAMMRLFGGFGDAAFAAYTEVAPLTAGWEVRIDLHQLAPLVVHAIKFGGGYARAVDAALDRLGT